jgi:beta-lactamase class A
LLSRITLVFAVFIAVSLSACVNKGETGAQSPAATPAASSTPAPLPPGVKNADFIARLEAICERAGGRCGVAVRHVEKGDSTSVGGDTPLPLYSVFKLPLAVAVLKEVEEGRLQLEQKIRVEPEEAAPGVKTNSDLWLRASDRTIRELLEFSIVRSDNTSSDKMLELVGGPDAVTRRMRALGLESIEIRASAKEFLKSPGAHPNTATPNDLARLLVLLQKGEVLAPPQLEVLLGLMGRVVTGDRRLRAGPPAGTPVADKTGTGPSTTNDVGIITLPENRGHLALAVLLDGSKLPAEKQEDLIAEVARTAYDAYVAGK